MAQQRQFGSFTFDFDSGELSSPGRVTRLVPQAAQVLRMLLDAPGTVVTRAELKAALWPDTTVEFDQGLNFCIRQIRAALDDSADQPRMIETLPRRGYRFIAPVSVVNAAPATIAPTTATPAATATPPSSPRRGAMFMGLGVAVVAVIAVGAFLRLRERSSQRLAVMPFDVDSTLSPGTDLQRGLGEAIVSNVTESGVAGVVGPSTTSRFSGTATPPAVLKEDLGATYVLSGRLSVRDSTIRIFAQLIRTADGVHVWAARLELPRRDSALISVPARAISDSTISRLKGFP